MPVMAEQNDHCPLCNLGWSIQPWVVDLAWSTLR